MVPYYFSTSARNQVNQPSVQVLEQLLLLLIDFRVDIRMVRPFQLSKLQILACAKSANFGERYP